jgi:hypothetical protein
VTRARRLQHEQHALEIERAGVCARRYFYLSRLVKLTHQAPANRRWMWFYLLVQAELSQQGPAQ